MGAHRRDVLLRIACRTICLFLLLTYPHLLHARAHASVAGGHPRQLLEVSTQAGGGTPQNAAAEAKATDAAAAAGHCDYGTLPGAWNLEASAGGRWQLLDPQCALQNLLQRYGIDSLDDAPTPNARRVGILLLSDSVDRYLTEAACAAIGGRKVAEFGAPSTDTETAASDRNKTALALHKCESQSQLSIASAYFPGVHPTGPYHSGLRAGYERRIAAAAAQWASYSPAPPDLVVVASGLWDIARMWRYEPHYVGGEQLELQLLRNWSANFTRVVEYAKTVFSQTPLWAFHTTVPPKFEPATGRTHKPYLGRRYFTAQLNAAGVAAARELGMQVVDYAALGDRFLDQGQAALLDLIHPKEALSLEFLNIYLNLLEQHWGGGSNSGNSGASGSSGGGAAAGAEAQQHSHPAAGGTRRFRRRRRKQDIEDDVNNGQPTASTAPMQLDP